MTPRHALSAALLGLLVAQVAMACRYTVREIGFVNLDGRPWTLVQVGTGFDSPLTVDPIETNLQQLVVDPARDPNHPAVLTTGGTPGFVLLGPNGRTLDLDTTDPSTASQLAVDSPIRSRIADGALDTFAYVLVIPGSDDAENARARSAAESAQNQLNALAPHLPRPVSNPLSVITLAREDLQRERVLLWSLGLDDSDQATLAVVYGRGRRAGPPIRGSFEDTELATQLALVGESCECETDRAWLKEPIAPLRWAGRNAGRAADVLGFDPASPMVQAEVTRILARGEFGTGAPREQGDGRRPKDLAEVVFGYSERSLDDRFGSGTPAPAPSTTDSTEPAASVPVTVTISRDDGWDFPDNAGKPTESVSAESPRPPASGFAFKPYAWALIIVVAVSGGAAWIIIRR